MILSQATFVLKIQLPLITPQSWDIQEISLHSPPPPPPPHPPPNIPYSWHIISIGPESCHQELWLVDIIPYYRRAPSKNIPSKRKWLRGQGLFCVGPFIIILYSVSPVVYEWHVENKKVTKINCTTCWV